MAWLGVGMQDGRDLDVSDLIRGGTVVAGFDMGPGLFLGEMLARAFHLHGGRLVVENVADEKPLLLPHEIFLPLPRRGCRRRPYSYRPVVTGGWFIVFSLPVRWSWLARGGLNFCRRRRVIR